MIEHIDITGKGTACWWFKLPYILGEFTARMIPLGEIRSPLFEIIRVRFTDSVHIEIKIGTLTET